MRDLFVVLFFSSWFCVFYLLGRYGPQKLELELDELRGFLSCRVDRIYIEKDTKLPYICFFEVESLVSASYRIVGDHIVIGVYAGKHYNRLWIYFTRQRELVGIQQGNGRQQPMQSLPLVAKIFCDRIFRLVDEQLTVT